MLTADQLLDFEELVESLIRELQYEIAAADTQAVAPDNAIGRLSRMDSIQHQEMAKAAVLRKQQRIIALEEARHRLDTGTFGLCTLCLQDIELDRLQAAPEATVCKLCSTGRS